ncbi:MAG: cobalamin-dependent protein, partial [Phycisphaerae bacterium]|nr:cobalamin-dependent protein [Phycisphaerae bacterium]
MRVLLMAMPDIAPRLFSRRLSMPNLALASLAGNAPGHDVWLADLIHVRDMVRPSVLELLKTYEPQVVGLSAMSFQYDTALQIAKLIRQTDSSIKMLLGGYHATLMSEEIVSSEGGKTFDFLLRGEGEKVFGEFLDVLDARDGLNGTLKDVRGLSYKDDGGAWHHNARAPILDLSTLRLPDRSKRVWGHFRFHARGFEVVETSRGCTMDCNFCSMRRMYGKTFRTYSLDRVVADLDDIKSRGTGMVLFADDNITLDTERLGELCNRIVKEKLNSNIRYIVQASSLGIASAPKLPKY